ncbi:MAG TPA: hypothetical protein ACFYEK_01420 [Candidatus Wunengus sp. YC60]|uniref:hypothetical protein n=1 Tax=Candidatus Wunengus sp. YC60 TaxID=3367697 RepID=UPI00402647DF
MEKQTVEIRIELLNPKIDFLIQPQGSVKGEDLLPLLSEIRSVYRDAEQKLLENLPSMFEKHSQKIGLPHSLSISFYNQS